jgi:hypothetical protein
MASVLGKTGRAGSLEWRYVKRHIGVCGAGFELTPLWPLSQNLLLSGETL